MRKKPRNFRDYISWFNTLLTQFADIIVDYNLSVEEVIPSEGIIYGDIMFLDGSHLYFLEYVSTTGDGVTRLKYRYHYARFKGKASFPLRQRTTPSRNRVLSTP